MQAPARPPDELERLAALRRLRLLDTPPEERFDRVTRIAERLFGVPIALVSLVDADRQWFKARVGLDASETSREVSFCGHAILEDHTFVVEDAWQDARFADNPLVTGAPLVRAYAGQPLRTVEGARVGTLCVIDRAPRRFNSEDLAALGDLARIVESEMNLVSLAMIQEQLVAAKRAADRANRVKSEFLANMSHELRTPLNSVIGFSNILLRKSRGRLADDELEYLERIRDNGSHLLSLINGVLDLSKIEAGRMELALVEVDLAELLRDVVAQFEPQVAAREIALQSEIPDTPVLLQTDGGRLRQVVLNLIANAVKFTSEGHVAVRLRLAQDARLRPACIEVEDTGIGIPAERREAIFEAFEQASEDTARTYGGTGLGLTISAAICRELGYPIELESEPGKGSCFRIVLP